MKLEMLFGSTSDKGKVMPGIEEFSKAHPDVEVYVHWASADNTPDKVTEICETLTRGVEPPMALISGAGMSNVLTGVVKQYATINDIVIGIPILDAVTGGLSSILSTSEKPPMNPVLATSLNGTYAAANIAYKFMDNPPKEVVVYVHPSMDSTAKLKEFLDKYGLEHRFDHKGDNLSDELVISPFDPCTPGFTSEILQHIDCQLTRGSGIQVAFMGSKTMCFTEYRNVFDYDLKSTCFTTAGNYLNAVIAAAQLTQNHEALAKIEKERDAKIKALNDEPMLMIVGGSSVARQYK